MLLELEGVAGEGDVVIGGKQGNQAEHEAANFGTEPRVVCILDVDRESVDDVIPD